MQTDVYLVAGFLGAGKTTLLKRLLSHPWEGRSAVLVNEFGAVGIDGDEVRRGSEYDLVEITSGCVCCTLRGRFVESFRTLLQDVKPAQIFVEASGVSEPSQILAPLRSPELAPRLRSVAVVTVVDATFLPKRDALGGFYEGQIAEAQLVLLNKVDQVDRREHEPLCDELQALNPEAPVVKTVHCSVDLDELVAFLSGPAVATSRPTSEEAQTTACDKPQFLSFSLEIEGSIPLEKLNAFLEGNADQILRAKGRVRTDRGMKLLSYSSHGLDVESAVPDPKSNRLAFVLAQGADSTGLQIALMGEFDSAPRSPSNS